jgi:hypothetical protein
MNRGINQNLINLMPLFVLGDVRFALVRYGGGVIQLSGSIAGNTYARNRSGNYVRARTTPINPNTPAQQAVRNSVAELTVRWSTTLTAVQRTAWNLYAASVAMKNKLGETIFLSGFNHYIRSNSLLLRDGDTIVDNGPTIFELPDQDPTFSITASEATQQISVVFDDTLAWPQIDDGFLHLFQGSPQNAQRNFFDGPWRFLESLDGDTAIPLTSPQLVAVTFAISEGQHLWVYGRIQLPDGRLSEIMRADTFCAA